MTVASDFSAGIIARSVLEVPSIQKTRRRNKRATRGGRVFGYQELSRLLVAS